FGERLAVCCDPPLPNPGSLANPLVRGLDDLCELGVRHHLRGHMGPEARDPDATPLRGADHRSTAKVSVPRAASASPTCAVAFPRPMGPRTASISQTSESVSPGETTRLK